MIIQEIISRPLVEDKLQSDALNDVQDEWFTLNELPVINPRDIALLKDLKDYPLPYVDSIDRQGTLQITFSRPIANC